MNNKVDKFLVDAKNWRTEMTLLRDIVMECNLKEEYKWMHPCYSLNGANVVLIHHFKEYCALLFFKGVLMKDPDNILVQQTENIQDRRQIRFTAFEEIHNQRSNIKKYILEPVEVEKSGLKVEFKKTSEFNMPEEFQAKLEADEILNNAFYSLTPGRQRAYLLYFSSAKQSATREARIEKYHSKIINGKGLDE